MSNPTQTFELQPEAELYDEFGNYLGDAVESESESEGSEDDWADNYGANEDSDASMTEEKSYAPEDAEMTDVVSQYGLPPPTQQIIGSSNNQIVLHEDKNYYPSAQEVYGPDVIVMVQEEDTQPLETPIIAPIKERCFELVETSLPKTQFSYQYLAGLMDIPSRIRNVAFVGHLHHGKTSFMDILVKESHDKKRWPPGKEVRYTDIRKDEQERGLSIKAIPMSLILPDIRGKQYLINIMDCPGHVNFSDEMTAAMRLVDGVVVFVDAAEGLMLNTERSMRHACMEKLPITLVINKIDRLIIELKLPPRDAYLKIVHTLADVNGVLGDCAVELQKDANGDPSAKSHVKLLDPKAGNVCFASSWFGWSFTLQSFAKLYSDYHGNFQASQFAKRLWGDMYLHTDRRIRPVPEDSKSKRTFVEFILEPLYKIYGNVLGNDPENLSPLLSELGVKMKRKELRLDPKPLLSLMLSRFFGNSRGFCNMVIKNIPSPAVGNRPKVERNYTGDLTTECGVGMMKCDPKAAAMVNITKMYPRPDATTFDAFGRVFSGTIHVGDRVRCLREGFSLDDDEDMSLLTIEKIWVYQGRYRVEINRVTAGNWALFGGLDSGITKTATITHAEGNAEACIFRPLRFNTRSVLKVAIEPIKPSELPKMINALRSLNKSYPLCTCKVEESGEHVLIGPGELYLDCLLRDLRHMYAEIEIKVSDPVVAFCETVVDTSWTQAFGVTQNKKNKLTMICEPLSSEIAYDIEHEKVSTDWSARTIGNFFSNKYNWPALAGRSIWSFGPDFNGPNILMDDSIAGETDKTLLNSVRNSVIQGFQWATREGPLCDEPIRNCQFKIVDANVAHNQVDHAPGQIIPTARRVLYSAFMLATPRLMEPVLFVECVCPPDCVDAVANVVKHRRGRINKEFDKPGTPNVIIHAEIPAIDSFGFETDLRSHTQGQAFCLQVFLRWDEVPGDPMDGNIVLTPLEPQESNKLAREFMVKTRKRKGLAQSVTYHKYFDDEMIASLAQQGME